MSSNSKAKFSVYHAVGDKAVLSTPSTPHKTKHVRIADALTVNGHSESVVHVATERFSVFHAVGAVPEASTLGPASSSSSSTSQGQETDDVYSLQAKITKQQSTVRQLKKDGADPSVITKEVNELLSLRAQLVEMEKMAAPVIDTFSRKAFDELILRKMYVVPSFEIHNGPAGLLDYGPPACTLKANVLSLWRSHFVLEESMLEMECTCLTPSSVLETSGHVERFTDFMVRDVKSGECFRADKLLEDAIDAFFAANPHLPKEEAERHAVVQRQAGSFGAVELHEKLQEYNVKSPTNKDNDLTEPFPFNLMFKTTIGPEGTSVGFLRPETAQGLFVNFKRLLDFNLGRMPFAAAQIGLGFRNEIAPRNGLLRVREFCMAEIEHFVNPNDKSHAKFKNLSAKELVLFPADNQLGSGRTVKMSIGDAVGQGIVNNQTLGYFMARTQLWLEKIGVDPERLRFRQHLRTEMAHYAADCWDAEIKLSYGWIECVGHADRACYDLQQHSNRTGVNLSASSRLDQPVLVEKVLAIPNKKLIGPRFKLDQKKVITALEELDGEKLDAFRASVESSGAGEVDGFQISADLVSFKAEKKLITEFKYMPSVIEPSFGIGRILYSVLEHSFSQRFGDEQRCVMRFKPCVAPVKLGIFRLINNPQFDPIVSSLQEMFTRANVSTRVDSTSGTVGRRYARADELGIPFGVTIDFRSLIDDAVTLRERDSMAQVRIPISRLLGVVQDLVAESMSWPQVMARFLVVNAGGKDEEDEGEADEKPKESGSTSADKVASSAPVLLETTARACFSRPNPNSF